MGDPLPTLTVIIPARPGQAEVAAVEGARRLDYPIDRVEILVARGRQPAVQRNVAMRAAQGELIYFLDDDSLAEASNARRALEPFRQRAVVMVGGPSVCPSEAPWIERVFAVVLGSWLAFGPSRARYEPVGRARLSGEKELILCNLWARRSALIEAGGFDEALYPNEENALMDELKRRGGRMVYDPELRVWRRPRPDLRAFGRMLLSYGRGRAEQFRRHPTLGSILNFVPPLFLLYLIVGPWWGAWSLLPLALYGLAVLGQSLVSAARHGMNRALAAAPLVLLTHVLYGLGFWRGLFTRWSAHPEARAAEVVLEQIQSLRCGENEA